MINQNNEEQISEYLLYSKLQDTIGFLGNNAIINMNVALYIDKKDNKRDYYRREVQYFDKNGFLSRKINRMINQYLSIEIRKPNGIHSKELVILTPSSFEFLRIRVLPWLEDVLSKIDSLYETREGKLYYKGDIVPLEAEIGSSCSIIFAPGIGVKTDGQASPMMEIYIKDVYNKTQVSYTELYGFVYLLKTFDLYQYASTMLSSFEQFQLVQGLALYDITSQQDLTPVGKYKYEEPEYIIRKREEFKKGFFETEIERRNNNECEN